jgi:protein farnesyltransferase subunit beta
MESPKATVTQEEQWMVEGHVFHIYRQFTDLRPNAQSVMLELQRDEHIQYLTKGLRQLSSSFSVLDANRPWLCYWILHSVALLADCVDAALESNAIDFLNRCQDRNGGYGGGPGQMPHLATTYAAVNSLITLGGRRSLSSINRTTLHSFLLRMKDTSGGFRMHDGGEIDVRACYTAISVASILNILDDELIKNVGHYVSSCQTYEGGIAGEPGSEAHGGYTFCGLATMILINEVNSLDLAKLIDWVVFRQGVEGGFQGRTNKLVDGCYSFWQGAVLALIQMINSKSGEEEEEEEEWKTDSTGSCDLAEEEEGTSSCIDDKTCHTANEPIEQGCDDRLEFISGHNTVYQPLFHSVALQQYILLCSQVEGGFRDKPGKQRDYYHTCYCLSGLSSAQYNWSKGIIRDSPPYPMPVLGPYSNLLEPIHPLHNVVFERYTEARQFFSTLS